MLFLIVILVIGLIALSIKLFLKNKQNNVKGIRVDDVKVEVEVQAIKTIPTAKEKKVEIMPVEETQQINLVNKFVKVEEKDIYKQEVEEVVTIKRINQFGTPKEKENLTSDNKSIGTVDVTDTFGKAKELDLYIPEEKTGSITVINKLEKVKEKEEVIFEQTHKVDVLR
ncbi:MAG: hypothetical protein R3Y05_03080 [bacterium]